VYPWNTAWSSLRQFWSVLFPPPAQDPGHLQWTDHLIRRMRYGLLWGFYDGSIYQGRYSDTLKREKQLYKHIRPIFSTCQRIVDFHVSHTQGGQLDPDAGDGKVVPSALPIAVDGKGDQRVRIAIARTWAASNWQVRKSLYTRYGACLGDVGLEAVADPVRGLVRIRVVHPAEIVQSHLDAYGNVKGYTLERWEVDPDDPRGERQVQYREVVENHGDGVVTYSTFREGSPYAWPGTEGAEWESRFGFVPLVLVKHIDMGSAWGISELQGALAKTIERDDQGSNLSDQVRKAVNGPWFLTGANLPAPLPRPASVNPWDGDPFAPGGQGYSGPNLRIQVEERDGIPIVTCNATDARMTPLVYPVPIADADAHIRAIGDAHEMDYPELQADRTMASGDIASARALRVARQKASQKVTERRAAYDDALVRAQKMALTMGGTLGFDGYEGCGEGAYEGGKLDHHILARPVFDPDPLDLIEEENGRAAVVATYVKAGMPLAEALKRVGVPEDQADAVAVAQQAQADELLAHAAKVTRVTEGAKLAAQLDAQKQIAESEYNTNYDMTP
jgi:hypothetical protein